MGDKMTETKLTRGGKASLIGRFVRAVWGHFVLGLLFAMLGMAFNALTPQIIRVTVDSILGSESTNLPAWLLAALGFEDLRAEPTARSG